MVNTILDLGYTLSSSSHALLRFVTTMSLVVVIVALVFIVRTQRRNATSILQKQFVGLVATLISGTDIYDNVDWHT